MNVAEYFKENEYRTVRWQTKFNCFVFENWFFWGQRSTYSENSSELSIIRC